MCLYLKKKHGGQCGGGMVVGFNADGLCACHPRSLMSLCTRKLSLRGSKSTENNPNGLRLEMSFACANSHSKKNVPKMNLEQQTKFLKFGNKYQTWYVYL